MDAILEQFLSEARENLSFLDKNLANLANGDLDEINALFRAAHTLKGGAGLVGLESIKTITHYAEDLLDGIKKNEISYNENMLDVLYDAFDEIVEMIDATEELGEIPEFDQEMVNNIANSVKILTGKVDKELDENHLDTELNIVTDEVYFGELISNHNISLYIKDLSFESLKIDQKFIEDENFYLIDMDLDDQSCILGNDPIYLLYLLDEDNIFSVNTTIYNCNELNDEPTLWKTRLTVVVKSSKDSLEDALYNILDDITIYPLNIKSLLTSSYESIENEIFDDFIKDFKKILDKNDYSEFSENLSAVTKILNPLSKEGFILSRLELLLPYFEFEGKEYIELIKYSASNLEIYQDNNDDLNNVDESQKVTVITLLKQQLKVLQFGKDEQRILRVKIHSEKALNFIGFQTDFDDNETKESLLEKISNYILILNPQENIEIEKVKKEEEKEVIEEEVQEIKEEVKEEKVEKKIEKKIEKVEKQVTTVKEVKKEEEKIPEKKHTPTPTIVPKTVKIDQADIDAMMDIIGELLVMKNALPYVANNITADTVAQSKAELTAKYEEINRVTEQLQDIVMGMRLLPLSYIFSRYPKLIRETSKKLGKKIRFEEYGGDTKLDKMMIEKIADPLVHIIRNSLDHGIEMNEQDRLEAGKEPQGFIKVGAKSEGDKVKIIIEDDGRGIDVQKVLIKALELKLITENDIEIMSEQEKLMLIFNPGLSTADKITDISGRGVGTDAVMKTITELKGNVHLNSKSGEGTTVIIELPVSVALTNVFCVKMNNNNYAIAMDNVIETIKIATEDMQIANNKPYARLRGEIIPLVFESKLLPANQQDEDIQSVVIVQANNIRYGLVVNEFINQLNVVQKPLDGAIANHPVITGTSLLGNGEILFILDVNSIIE